MEQMVRVVPKNTISLLLFKIGEVVLTDMISIMVLLHRYFLLVTDIIYLLELIFLDIDCFALTTSNSHLLYFIHVLEKSFLRMHLDEKYSCQI